MLIVRSKLAVNTAAAMLVIVAIATVSRAQSNRMDNKTQGDAGNHAWKASELIGLKVYTMDNQEKGKIQDLMISPSGKVEYVAVSFGGFMGIGDKLFAVPLDAIHLEWKDNKVNHANVEVTEESIKQHKAFDENHWPEQGDRGFMTSSAGRNGNARTTNH
jgi:sporulation protein YlmC with PRC-barrel domain